MKAVFRIKMKKLFAGLLALAVLVSLFAGCSKDTQPADPSATTVTPTEAAATDAPTEATHAADLGAWRVALLTEEGEIDDQSVMQALYEASATWCGERGVAFTYYAPTETTTGRFNTMVDQAVADGCNVLLMRGRTFVDVIKANAEKYPDVKFVIFDVTPNYFGDFVLPANACSAVFYEQLAGFMAGYAAVKLGYRHLGFLGGIPRDTIRYGYGFVQGVNAAAVELDVQKEVAVEFAYGNMASPGDSAIAVYLNNMYQKKGVEICFGCGGFISPVCEAAQKVDGAKVIGADCDQAPVLDPVYGEGITVTSCVRNYAAAVGAVLGDTIENNRWRSHGGKAETLGVISGDDPNANFVILAPSTQFADSRFTEDDYAAFVAALFGGEYTISDETVIAPTVDIAVNYYGNLD